MPRGVKAAAAAAAARAAGPQHTSPRRTTSTPKKHSRPAAPSISSSPVAGTARKRATTSTVLNHSIPPLYSCYMLRSFNPKRTATYIGSTPDPPRRIKQHNGLIKGATFKTRYGRPWEQELIVYGFPSKLQALQFEWAWQNPHASRHLHATPTRQQADLLSDDGPAAKSVAQFPKTSMSNRPQTKVQVLQYMLTVPPWRAFKLQVLLFSQDAQSWWDNARAWGPTVRSEAALRKWLKERARPDSESGLADPWGDDGRFLDSVHVEMRRQGVDGGRLKRTGIDEDDLDKIRVDDGESRQPECHAAFHMPCLAKRFIERESSSDLLPRRGTCPSCSSELHWQDLIRGAYRRKEKDDGSRKKGPRPRVRRLAADATPHRRKRKSDEISKTLSISAPRALSSDSELDSVTSGADESDADERSWARMAEVDDDVLEGDDDTWDHDGILYYEPIQIATSQPGGLGFSSTKPNLAGRNLKLTDIQDDIISDSSDGDLPVNVLRYRSRNVLELSD
ncbi:Slx4p interacting protein [Microbotryomycetes sp. JL201]|nr:Slx4p interacting protein [Microbotryomycetes sp. JL201]